MKKNLGFTRFEFYFVMSAIGVISLIAIQRYLTLSKETQRFSFEIVTRNFNAALHNQHTRWVIAQQQPTTKNQLNADGITTQFSPQGWPVAVMADGQVSTEVFIELPLGESIKVSIKTCLSLWQNFLQNPPALSYAGGDAYGTRAYHLSLPSAGSCRFEFITKNSNQFFLDYNPASGEVIFHTPPFVQK